MMRFHGVWIDARPETYSGLCERKHARAASYAFGLAVKLETVAAFFCFRFMRLI